MCTKKQNVGHSKCTKGFFYSIEGNLMDMIYSCVKGFMVRHIYFVLGTHYNCLWRSEGNQMNVMHERNVQHYVVIGGCIFPT